MRLRTAVLAVALVSMAAVATAGVAAAQTGDECSFPYDGDDQLRDSITTTGVDEKPETVVTGAPSVTQILWEMGLQDRVVGVSNQDSVDYLEGVDEKTDVGSAVNSSTFAFDSSFPVEVGEADGGSSPDLLIGALNVFGLEDGLEPYGDVYDYHWFVGSGDFGDIEDTVRDVGRMTGECEAAENVVEEFRGEITKVETSVGGREPVSVLYTAPTEGTAFVPGNGTFIHDIITTAGGENIYAELGIEGFKQIEDETSVNAVVGENPDWIVLPGGGPEDVPNTDLYNDTTAVREDQVLVVNPDYVQQSAPRVTVPLGRMARSFHPEAFANPGDGGGDGGSGRLEAPDGSGDGLTVSVSVVDDVSRAEFEDGPVETVELGAAVEGDVTVRSLNASSAPGTPLTRFSVTVPEEARDSPGTVRLRADGSSLDEAGVSSEELVVVKLGDGPPTPLNTTAFDTEAGVTVVADTPGFSEFAVVASTPPRAVAEASAENGSVTLSASGSYDVHGEVVGYDWTVGDETHEVESVTVETDADEATLTVTNDAGLTNGTAVELPGVNGTARDDEETEETNDGNRSEVEGDESGTDGETDGEDDGEGLPGFTAVAALVALVAALALRR